MALCRNAQNCLQLACGDDQARGCNETSDDGMRQEIGHESQAEHPHYHQEYARQKGQGDGGEDVVVTAWCRDARDRRRCEQGDDRHGTNG